MITFTLNGTETTYSGDENLSLLNFLRNEQGITSAKDGCSGQAACGACLVEMGGKPTLACATKMTRVAGKAVITIEGFPENVRRTLARAFVLKGAVQCGFCTPGFLARAKILLENNPDPSRADVIKALNVNICRCTGYSKIIDGILLAAKALRENSEVEWESRTGIGYSYPKVEAYEKALGIGPYVADMKVDNMCHGALCFSEHPRAVVKKIDVAAVEKIEGVIRVFTGADIPGERFQGLSVKDWPMMVLEGETTRCIGDVLACVVAETEAIARAAVEKIKIDYEVLEPLTEMSEARDSKILIHEGGNLLKETVVCRGKAIEDVFSKSAYVVEGQFETPFIEHGFLETEASISLPDGKGGLIVYSQSQALYKDRGQIASILALEEEKVDIVLMSAGGAFGGKEDLTVQHHAALAAMVLQRPVRVRLSRPESLRMHPKRHRMKMNYTLACDEKGMLTGLKARIIGDTGAYASMGAAVVGRTGTHAGAAYHIPNVDVISEAYYTNNPVAGAFRGFGVSQSNFAMESMVDELCTKGGFDKYQFRYDNALDVGRMTTTGHVLKDGVGLRECLESVKDAFKGAKYAGLACAIKNCGIGNGIEEISDTKLKIVAPDKIELYHGWSEMGQGIDTVARQVLGEVCGLDDSVAIEVKSATSGGARGGATTASRGTVLLGNSTILAAEKLKNDLADNSLAELVGKEYFATYTVDWTTSHEVVGNIISHFSYGYAVHLAILDEDGKLQSVHAAHDGGKIINPTLFEGQIEGGVVMGMGYALSENFPVKDGKLTSDRMAKLGLPKAKDMPEITVIGVECPDSSGPFGAKGVGEIASIPTPAAIANSYYSYDGVRRRSLPLLPTKKKEE
ncbi:selenium-dependent xanthine dehydrogenase [Desulforhopalus sp. IMCC35007]|uniref:selenium-dependent xanthine dehydrogenase n=1 Tax=Desulforhopalus sp. IMCC35007 TaxID=2569543 RepID=UPI0010AE50C4|nr:selenium-dependent xanthine dehydrogenase [Desulforhopalus sp. IMCC35007]TKB06779.1 selenium-dependent xanthine dehydrogenase [Desulforhopalus sp. IMCC35007]